MAHKRSIQSESSCVQLMECNKSQQKRRMLTNSKYSISKMNKMAHKNLIKRYKINFNPLLLPKLALLGYQLKNDPSFQVFLAKLQLFDKSAIQRENIFIEHMKQLMKSLEKQGQKIEENILLLGIEKQSRKQIKSCINLQEDKHKYGKILTNRLTDLNQLIFHVERLDKQPVQQKQCKSILENEISKINLIKYEDKKNKENEDKELMEQQGLKKYFKMSDFKLNQMNKRINDVNSMLKTNRFQRKYKKSKTAFDIDDLKQQVLQAHLLQQQLNDRPKSQEQDDQQQRQLVSHVEGQSNRKPIIKRNAMVSRISKNGIKFTNNLINKVQTQPNEPQTKSSKIKKRQGKSVRYNVPQQQNQSNEQFKNKQTSLANIRSSRSIKRSDNKLPRGTQSQILAKNRNFISNSKKKSIKINLQLNEDQQSAQSDQRNRNKSRVKTVKFNEHLIEQKTNYIKATKYKRKFGKKDTKILMKRTQSIDGTDANTEYTNKQNEKIDSKRQLNSSKIIRREAFQQSQPITNLINSTRSVANMKRKGKILGIQANKHLQRLLMQQNIQQMLIDNQLYDNPSTFLQKYKSKHNKGKYASRKLVTDMSRSANRSKTKHDILMEVDIEDQDIFEDSTQYVSNQGFKVQYNDLKTIRQSYAKIIPYHHKMIGQFYGGQHFQMINHEFNTNQHGQYFFNRLVLQTVRNSEVDDYIPYDFTQFEDKYEAFRIDFGKHLSKQLSNIKQIDLRQRASVISYV